MKATCLAFLILLSALSASPAASQTPVADSLSLEAVVRRVLETHPAVQQAAQGVRASQARVLGSRSAYYPEIEADGSYLRLGPTASIDIPNLGAFDLYPANNYDAHLSLRHTVFDFGKRSTAVDYAQSLEQTAGHTVEVVQAGLAFEAIDTFYAIIFLERSLDVQDDQIAALERHLEVTREKVRTGSATDFEVLTTEVRVATAQSRRIDLANALTQQAVRLRGLMGLPADQPLNLAGTFPAAPAAPAVDSLVALALTQRPELKISRDGEASAAIQTRLASLGDRPSLAVGVMAGFKNGYVPNLNTLKGNWDAGVQVRVPIFDGFRVRRHVAETQAAAEAAQDHTRDVERRVTTEVRQAVADVQAGVEKLAASDLQVRQAEAAVSMADVRYEAGVITNLDVLDAQTSLQEARLMRLRAQYDVVRARYELERAVGARVW
jgi:outer membrane protein TolC